MSTATEITRLQTAKTDLKTSINAKLSAEQTKIADELIDDYSGFVDNILQGGGGTDHSAEFIERNTSTPVFPSNLTNIGAYAFYFWSDSYNGSGNGLRITSLPSGVTTIGSAAFYNCTNLALTSLPSGVTYIGTNTFKFCTNLALTSLPSGVTTIHNGSFYGCESIISMTFPNALTTIGTRAFSYCKSLTTLEFLSTTPPTIQADTFQGCTALTTVYVPAGTLSAYQTATNYDSTNNNLVSKMVERS
jgi:hypothetical protein